MLSRQVSTSQDFQLGSAIGYLSRTPVTAKDEMATESQGKQLFASMQRQETENEEHFLENDFSLPDELHYRRDEL